VSPPSLDKGQSRRVRFGRRGRTFACSDGWFKCRSPRFCPHYVRSCAARPCSLDACVPCISTFRSRGAQAFAELFQAIRYGEVGDVFDALVPELSGDPEAKRSAECDGKLAAIHAVRDESLRVQCIGHVDAFPPVRLDRTVDNVSALGESPHNVQDLRERYTPPFGYIRPALFARQMSDLAAPGKALEFTEGKRCRASNHSIHC
jgi:hypothetical protein